MVPALQCDSDMSTLTVAPSTLSTADDLIGELLVDRYRLVETLGVGAHGWLYRARDALVGHSVAIKLLNPMTREPSIARDCLYREAVALARISHPNVVSLLDYRHDGLGESSLIALEYVAARTLSDHVGAFRAVPWRRAIHLCVGMLHGLAAVHAVGLVHGDVKPNNVLIARGTGRVVLVDFGLATARGGAIGGDVSMPRSRGWICGTPGFIAPEVAAGRAPTAASDVYAAGVVLYRLLSGRMPFVERELSDVLRRPSDPGRPMMLPPLIRDAVPPAVKAALWTATSADPALRYGDADAFCRALTRCLAEPSPPRLVH